MKKYCYTPNGLGAMGQRRGPEARAVARDRVVGANLLWLTALVLPLPAALAQTNLPRLTAAEQVHQLSSEEAKLQYPVRVRGVATFVDQSIDQLFIQDDSGGIFVEIHGEYGFAMRSGQLLEVEGVSAPGGFAPDIEPRSIRLVGAASLPLARSVTYEQMATGQQDCNWVEFSGVVRSVSTNASAPGLELVGGGGRVVAAMKELAPKACERLIDAEITVRGVCIAQFNRKGQLIQVALEVPGMAQISVRKAAPADPYGVNRHQIGNLLQYAPQEEHGHRVKVEGVVMLQRSGRSLYIADETEGLCVETRQTTPVKPGDRVQVLGFPAAGQYVAPVLRDAVFRKIGAESPLLPVKILAENGRRDTNHAALVQIEAMVVNRVQRLREQVLELQSGSHVFDAQLEVAGGEKDSLAGIASGSRVLVTGVCLVPADLDLLSPRPQPFSLLLRSAADVTVLQRPSWWTAQHTLWVLALTLAVFCASLAWLALLHKQVKAQTRIISQKVQREAALEERARIARDLHDDLGASLTHISFLSGVAQKESDGPQGVKEHLHEISGSAQEAFRALDEIVWVVNPRNDTLDGLTNYACHFAADFFRGTATRCRLDLPPSLPDLPISPELRNNLFFAIKEAFHNIRKHAQASEVLVRVRVESGPPTPGLLYCISIADNGQGFAAEQLVSSRNGLSNMRNRLEQIGGRFNLESGPGLGTKVHLTVPLDYVVKRQKR